MAIKIAVSADAVYITFGIQFGVMIMVIGSYMNSGPGAGLHYIIYRSHSEQPLDKPPVLAHCRLRKGKSLAQKGDSRWYSKNHRT